MRTITLLAVLCGATAAQNLPAAVASDDALYSVLWAQTAVEHDAAYQQAYHMASLMLDRALKNKSWTAAVEQRSGYERLPPAIILDIDETILDNSPAEAEHIKRGVPFSASLWSEWVSEESAAPLPGAVAFTRYAAERHVEVIYVTNRDAPAKEATRRVLGRAGFPLHEGVETIYCRGDKPEWRTDKSSRRAVIAQRYRILLLIGDDLGDFMPGARASLEERRRLAATYASWWGERWIILPNAMYGSWEEALPVKRDYLRGLEKTR